MPLNYLSNFWKLLGMPLINCKVELKLKWTRYCVLSANISDNNDASSDNVIFTIKDTKLYVPVVTLITKNNQKFRYLFSKGFERSVYQNEYKTKSGNKYTAQQFIYFLKPNFVRVNTLFVLVYSNQDENSKRFKTWRYYLVKGIIHNYKAIINGKKFYNQSIDSDIKLQRNKKVNNRTKWRC